MKISKSSKIKHDPVILRIMKNNVLTKEQASKLTKWYKVLHNPKTKGRLRII